MTERRGRRIKQLLDGRKEKRSYWKLKDEALVRTVWGAVFARVLWTFRKTDCAINEYCVLE